MPARVFVAIEVPSGTRDLLCSAVDALVHAEPAWVGEKMVARDLLHVTLAFFGAVPDPDLPDVLRATADACACAAPFALRLSALRAVPSPRRSAMVWATLDGDVAAAGDLADALMAAARLDTCPRPFRPHVTLARARRPRPLAPASLAAAEVILSDPGKASDRFVSVRSVTVFSSTLGPGGPVYENLAELSLGSAPS